MRPTIAIIDADAGARRALRTLLAPLDVDVREYDTAESYLKAGAELAAHSAKTGANNAVPACLVVDVHLPGMSGLQLLQRVRSDNRDLPVVLIASDVDVPMAVQAMRDGATDFIEKPQLDVALLRRVSQLLQHGANGTDDSGQYKKLVPS